MSATKILAIAVLTAATASTVQAETLTTLYSFPHGPGSAVANGGLILHGGLLYGTTQSHGANNEGSVFTLNPATGAETTLYSFKGGTDGADPSGLTYNNGTFYGTTALGGNPACVDGCGTVFAINAATGAETQLYQFPAFKNGSGDEIPGGLLYHAGKLFGTTAAGGNMCGGGQGCGTVFTLDPATGAFATFYAFTGGADGDSPTSLIFRNGAFYGSTAFGAGTGCNGEGCGTLFKLDPATGALTVLHTFTGGADGSWPYGIDYQGNMIYGDQFDAVFSFNPTTQDVTILHSFGEGSGGQYLSATPILYKGALYGTTYLGGDYGTVCPLDKHNPGCGVIYKTNPKSGATKVVHTFTGPPDGAHPRGDMTFSGGVFYGATDNGGTGKCKIGCGTIFKFTP